MAVGPNVYAYVKQNPWTNFDPDGLYSWSEFGSDFAGTIGNAVGGALELAGHGIGGVAETFTGGYVYSGYSEKFNRGVAGAGKGMVHFVDEGMHGIMTTAQGRWGETGEHLKNMFGHTPGEMVGNVLTIAATEGASRALAGPKGAPVVEVSASASGTAAKTEQAALLNAPEVQAQLKASAMAKGDTYGHLTDHPSVAPGKKFTASQLEKAKADNMSRNGGVLRDDVTGEKMAPSVKATPGSKVDPTSVQGDHVTPRVPKDPGTTPRSNSFSNLKLRRAAYNREKSNN